MELFNSNFIREIWKYILDALRILVPQTNGKHTSRQPKIKHPPLTRLDLTKTTHKLDLLSVCLVIRSTIPTVCSFQSSLSHTSPFNGLGVHAANKPDTH
ncbi:hypothetical protein JHK85_011788 [Glycine max]|nr:hypothetical protein JHK85_011788 [Glycine max]KHN27396.1 hypothetical protein glysoja_022105 [Glycine soja]